MTWFIPIKLPKGIPFVVKKTDSGKAIYYDPDEEAEIDYVAALSGMKIVEQDINAHRLSIERERESKDNANFSHDMK